ncbi:Lrp/AsnC family transcriptional regulator [Streptomyces sp. NPDC055210]
MSTVTLDSVDRKVIHALQIDGRASFTSIAEVLEVSDQTVARRYRRLRTARAMRVLGLPNLSRFGSAACVLRVQCTPTGAREIANALAAREDTSWVSLTAGGTEIVCLTRTGLGSGRAPLLLQKLPHTPRVVGITAQYILRMFSGGPTGWHAKSNALTPAQVARLRPADRAPAPERTDPVQVREGDAELLALLATDGRAGHAKLAAATGLSETTVMRRIDQLTRSGALFFDVEVDSLLLGYELEVMLWLSVAPSDLVTVGHALARHPEVVLAAAVTGTTNLLAIAVCRTMGDFCHYLTDKIGELRQIQHVESAPVMRSVKQAGTLVPEMR